MLNNLTKLPRSDRVRDTVSALADFISTSGLDAGDQLPTERAIMDALGIGRSSAREALRHLQALGVVETRKGSGSYLLRVVSASTIHMPLSFDAAHQRDALLQTLDVRRGLEVEASMLAVRRAGASDIARIRERLEEMERVHLDKGTAGREDLQFHLSIYDATGNPLFRQLLEQMREAFEHFFDKPFDRPDFARRSFPFHRELFDAIAAGDAPLARQKTIDILDIVEEDIKDMSL
ncbi:GntR family transcriptional regulator [Aureimonas sp. Leaf460]|uniref:FadR/GntR family transcriptional regulator n=2 Tax=unclassified Aureimonas TaxID=2615206 RepID=UPI0006FEED40|nr:MULTISPECIES: FadR/GntR family transcriptional regulator [unclassified Aureimonas]KQT69030.1 GntR family transcriptional regulator [Aureimonas sp. Leaf460]KQT69264.1 GntR family transcriptional regulator [Aureimonas sp. Leaf427]